MTAPARLCVVLLHYLWHWFTPVEEDKINLTSWTETDFRTGDEPWWDYALFDPRHRIVWLQMKKLCYQRDGLVVLKRLSRVRF